MPGVNHFGESSVYLLARNKVVIRRAVWELPMPDMIVQHLNSKSEREGLTRGTHDSSIGPDDLDDREDEDEDDSSSNLQPIDTLISSDSGVGTPLLSPPKTPVISRTFPDDVRRQRGVNNKTPHAVIGSGLNPLSPDDSPQTPNTLRTSNKLHEHRPFDPLSASEPQEIQLQTSRPLP